MFLIFLKRIAGICGAYAAGAPTRGAPLAWGRSFGDINFILFFLYILHDKLCDLMCCCEKFKPMCILENYFYFCFGFDYCYLLVNEEHNINIQVQM